MLSRRRVLSSLLLSGAGGLLRADDAVPAHRKGSITIRTSPGAKIAVEQMRHEFWFGATLPGSIFSGKASPEDVTKFHDVFTSHFNAAVVESAFKWHEMERERGRVNYAVVDDMLAWARKVDVPVRGHCIYWGVPKYVPAWLKELNDDDLRLAVQRRGRSIGARFRGQFAEYDLNNEMIHANYFEERCGPEFIKQMALWVKDGDPGARLYLNDYDITTGRRLADYVKHIRRLLDMGVPLAGIGVQGHLHAETFDPAALKQSLDELAQFKLPVRITEFNIPGQRSKYYKDRALQLTAEEEQLKAEAIKQFYSICFAHPVVTGILMWGFWEGANWIPQSSLYKRDWTPLPAAEAYRSLVTQQWWTRTEATAGRTGTATVQAFFGKHRVTANGREAVVELPRAKGSAAVTLT